MCCHLPVCLPYKHDSVARMAKFCDLINNVWWIIYRPPSYLQCCRLWQLTTKTKYHTVTPWPQDPVCAGGVAKIGHIVLRMSLERLYRTIFHNMGYYISICCDKYPGSIHHQSFVRLCFEWQDAINRHLIKAHCSFKIEKSNTFRGISNTIGSFYSIKTCLKAILQL